MSNVIVTPAHNIQKPVRPFRRVLLVLAIVSIAGSAALLATLIIVLSSNTPSPVLHSPFCCENVAANILEALSTSVKPCDNFYDHVCAQAADNGSTLFPVGFRIQIQLMSLDKHPQLAKVPLSRVFMDIATSCAEQNWKPDVTSAAFTSAILEVGNISASMDASQLLRLFLLMSLKYHIPVPIFFQISKNVKKGVALTLIMERQHSPAMLLKYICPDCIPPILHAVNNAFNVNVTLTDLLRFDKFVNASEPASETPIFTLVDISHVPIRGVKSNDWSAILNEVVFPVYPDVLYLEQDPQGRYDLLESLANPENQPVSIVYLTAFIVVHSYEVLSGDSSSQQGKYRGCSDFVRLVTELKDAYEAQVVASNPRDERVRELFSIVSSFVTKDAASGSLLNDEGEAAIRKQLNTLKLLLPRDITAADLPTPTIPPGFLPGILVVQSYAYDMKRAKVKRRIPLSLQPSFPPDVERHDDLIFVSSALYLMMEFESNHWLYLNLPVVGVRMARELWSFLLDDKRPWSLKTKQKIAAYNRCFLGAFVGGQAFNETESYIQAMTLAFSSITKSVDKLGWYDIKKISGSTGMSRGQLYYFSLAYSFCTGTFLDPKTEVVNIPVKNVQDFALTFGCNPGDKMIQPTRC